MNPVEQVRIALRQAVESAQLDLQTIVLVAGVSGGPDSLALLHLLRQVMPPDRLVVAHLDHGLRPTSATEAEIVAAIAGDARFHVERIDVGEVAGAGRLSLEEAGRIARYDFLARVARSENAPVVAVGHNADDQVETVLMHILRGTGLSGLRGMPTVSRMPQHPDLWLLRPLLHITRAEIETYCAENNLKPIIDASNDDQTFFRNRLRHDLLPLLETYNPQFRRRLQETADVVIADDDLLSMLTEQAWEDIVRRGGDGHIELHRSKWRHLPLAVRRRLLRMAVATVKPAIRDVGYRTLESARKVAESNEAGSRAALPGGIMLLVSYNRLIIADKSADLSSDYPQILTTGPGILPVPGVLDLDNGRRLTAEVLDRAAPSIFQANDNPWTAYVTLEAQDTLVVRPRLPGEHIRPLGMSDETTLKEIMINRKIPAHARARWPIVATNEHAIWVVGHVLDDRAKVRVGGGRIVRLRCLDLDESDGG